MPFGQASRLRMNESHLSRELSPQFLGKYFEKKRSKEGHMQRVKSDKQIEYLKMNSPSSSRETHKPARDTAQPDN